MQILGQFNLGFIVCRLGQDLYIIDQHASDEKYNYHTLSRSTTINTQPFITPQQLEMSAAEEVTVLDNLDIFKRNGFDFVHDPEAPATKRLKLASVPFSKHTFFGQSDVHELVCLLQESPGQDCRPSKVNSMFASRACRSAVMIGDPLDHSHMTKIVRHMATIDQPWNCPHGRPTMRHIFDMNVLKAQRKECVEYPSMVVTQD